MSTDKLLQRSESYLDAVFGEGAGKRHAALIDRFDNPSLRRKLHEAHAMQADTSHLSVEENYLLGMAVSCATGNYGPAAMFAKTLRHVGVSRDKILEAVARLSTWIGVVPAAEAMGRVQKALNEYDKNGLDSMQAWFPAP